MAWVGKTEDLSGLEPDSEDWISPQSFPKLLKEFFTKLERHMFQLCSRMKRLLIDVKKNGVQKF